MKNTMAVIIVGLAMLASMEVSAESKLPFGRYKELNVYFIPYNEVDFSHEAFIQKASTSIKSTDISYVMAFFSYLNSYKFTVKEDSRVGLDSKIKVLIEFYDPLEDKRLVLVSDGKSLLSSKYGLISDVPDNFLSLFTLSGSELIKIVSIH